MFVDIDNDRDPSVLFNRVLDWQFARYAVDLRRGVLERDDQHDQADQRFTVFFCLQIQRIVRGTMRCRATANCAAPD